VSNEVHGLHWIDGAIIGLYACGMLALGWYYGRKQQNADEYFVGSGAMNALLIGVSLFATLFSTISYLSTPGELINHGPAMLTGIFAIPIVYLIVGYGMVPVYMRYRVTSAYELLERNLGLSVRMTGAVMFIVLRLMWMGLLIYFASKAMMVMLGLELKWLPAVTLLTGSVAIAYASLGGLRAVVITDFFQFMLLFGGALLVIATITVRLGGFSWFPTEWNASWDVQPLFSADPAVRVTVFGSVLHGILWWLCTAGGDQTAIQRFMATRDARAARRSFLTNSIAGAMVSLVLALVGFSLLGYFQAEPTLLPGAMSVESEADLLFPHFISHHLPIGLSGLVVAGMFAAAMSSIDSGVNSITAVVMTDFLGRFKRRPATSRGEVRLAQCLAFGIGLTVVGSSSLMENVPGNFLEMTKRTIGLFVTPIFVLFFMALFVRFATSLGAISGSLAAFVSALLVAYWKPLVSSREISFQWIFPVSLAVGIVVGCCVSLIDRWCVADLALDEFEIPVGES
jgi:SSS family solute:Na+ symporter